jgi:hypothetical protein
MRHCFADDGCWATAAATYGRDRLQGMLVCAAGTLLHLLRLQCAVSSATGALYSAVAASSQCYAVFLRCAPHRTHT